MFDCIAAAQVSPQRELHIKKLHPKGWSFVLALPIFTASHPATIVGANELNFCVRDGNRWTLTAINTNFFGWLLSHLVSSKAFGF